MSRLALFALLAFPAASFGQLKVMTSGGFSAALQDLLPQFEKTSGITATVSRGSSQGAGPNTIAAQLHAGAEPDLVILAREGLNDLIAQKRIVLGSDRDLAQTVLGVAIRAGAPKPDLTTVESFKQMLLRATSINLPSVTRIYMLNEVLPRLGILDQIRGKLTDAGADAVSKGAAEMAIQPVSEILHMPGVELGGTIPREIQRTSIFSAAIVEGAAHAAAARRLIAFLASPNARAVLADHGMEPAKSR